MEIVIILICSIVCGLTAIGSFFLPKKKEPLDMLKSEQVIEKKIDTGNDSLKNDEQEKK